MLPARPAMTCHVQRQFKAAPDPQLVECGAKVVLHDLFGCAQTSGNITIGQPLPDQRCDLYFLCR